MALATHGIKHVFRFIQSVVRTQKNGALEQGPIPLCLDLSKLPRVIPGSNGTLEGDRFQVIHRFC